MAESGRESTPGAAEELEFINLISHELRGPTALLRGHLSMWLDGNPVALPSELLPSVQACYGSVLRLNNLINQMILALRIRRKTLVANYRPLDLTQWLRALAHDISLIVTSTRHGFQLELPPSSIHAEGDPFLLGVALFNLVDNAQKFSSASTIVRIALSDRDGGVAIDVIDQGQGFPQGFTPEAFARVDRDLGFERPGVGVGLYIAQGVAAAHGGRLEFSSAPGGSSVRLWLPSRKEELNEG
jgi:signal transduction histidine kinase